MELECLKGYRRHFALTAEVVEAGIEMDQEEQGRLERDRGWLLAACQIGDTVVEIETGLGGAPVGAAGAVVPSAVGTMRELAHRREASELVGQGVAEIAAPRMDKVRIEAIEEPFAVVGVGVEVVAAVVVVVVT